MSYLGIVFTFVFGGNVLFQYGAGSCLSSDYKSIRKGSVGFFTLGFVALSAAAIHTTVTRYLLAPYGLETLEPLAYVLLVASLLYGIAAAISSGSQSRLADIGEMVKQQVLSCVVYAAALAVSRGGFSFIEAAAAGFFAALGWWCAVVLLNKMMERLELEDIPAALSGVPLRFISAGLIAMAFSGVDKILVSRLTG